MPEEPTQPSLQTEAALRDRVHRALLVILLVSLASASILALVSRLDRAQGAPWLLPALPTLFLGWVTGLYGLFWIAWWFFWQALEGGEQTIELYGVQWAPLTTDYVRTGPFRWLRYPLAFGSLEFLWGLGFLARSTTIVLLVVPVLAVGVVIYLRLVVERRKLRTYGEAYQGYRRKTPLIVPRIPDRYTLNNVFRRRPRD